MSRKTKAFDQWMYTPGVDPPSDPLTPDQQALFDRGYRRCERRALSIARKIAGDANAEDIVHAALVWLVFLVTRKEDRRKMPADEKEFGRRFLGLIHLIGKSTVWTPDVEPPAHTGWGQPSVPVLGRKKPERLLTRDMESLDEASIDIVFETEDLRDEDRELGFLRVILLYNACQLGLKQLRVVVEYVKETPREIAAKKLGISVKTFDNTLARAKVRLREMVLKTLLWEDIRFAALSDWMEDFAEMEARRLVAVSAKAREELRGAGWPEGLEPA